MKDLFLVLDNVFNLKYFNDNTKAGSRRLNKNEKGKLNSSAGLNFDFYNELLRLNAMIQNNNKSLSSFNIKNIITNLNNDDNNLPLHDLYLHHIFKSSNFDFAKQETIPIYISSNIGLKHQKLNKINNNTIIDFITDGRFEI